MEHTRALSYKLNCVRYGLLPQKLRNTGFVTVSKQSVALFVMEHTETKKFKRKSNKVQ